MKTNPESYVPPPAVHYGAMSPDTSTIEDDEPVEGDDAEGEVETQTRRMLSTSDEVISEVERIIARKFLVERFTQSDVLNMLHIHRLDANRSTLRTALNVMAQIGTHFVIDEPGRGRRATIFRLLTSQKGPKL